MKNSFFFLYIISLCISCNSCDPVGFPEPCKKDYAFSIPITLSPALDTFHRGDTITVEIIYPSFMENLVDSSLVDMSTFPFDLETNSAWLNYNPTVSAERDFEYIPIIGEIKLISLSSGGIAVNLRPILINDTYQMSFKVVLDSTGLTGIGFYNRPSLGGYTSIESNCNVSSLKFFFSTNHQDNNNFAFLEYSADPRILDLEKSDFDQYGNYAFVIE